MNYGVNSLPRIAMEYMDGGTLAERVGAMALPRALWTVIAVTKDVRHVHCRGVAHLNLKPENVLFRSMADVTWDVPKVGDWSLRTTSPFLFCVGFVFKLIIGGATGVFEALIPVDMILDDT